MSASGGASAGVPLEDPDGEPGTGGPDSYERLAHDSGVGRFLLDLREGEHDGLRSRLLDPRLERFIGVIYRPETERWSHYSACSLPQQFDGYAWFDETSAVTPLPTRQVEGPEETYPFGV
jgi:erythromycin esterase-like protein